MQTPMQTEWLYYFIDVAQTLSMTQTAQKFSVSQQSIGHALKNLEETFKTKLFRRTRHGIILTPDGRTLLGKATQLIVLYENMQKSTSDYDVPPLQGTLTIGVHPRLFQLLLPDLLYQFSSQYPLVSLRVIEAPNIALLQLLAQKKIDLGLFTLLDSLFHHFPRQLLNAQNQNVPFILEELFTDRLIFCVSSSDERFQNHSAISMAEIAKSSLVVSEPNNNVFYFYDTTLPRANKNIYHSNNAYVHKQLLLSGLAAEILSETEFNKLYHNLQKIKGIPIDTAHMSIFAYGHCMNAPLDAVSQAFLDLLHSTIGRECP